jgi:hypothetical protein
MAQASLSVSWRAGPLWPNNEVPDVLRNDDTFDISECKKARPRIAPRPAAVPRYIRSRRHQVQIIVMAAVAVKWIALRGVSMSFRDGVL